MNIQEKLQEEQKELEEKKHFKKFIFPCAARELDLLTVDRIYLCRYFKCIGGCSSPYCEYKYRG